MHIVVVRHPALALTASVASRVILALTLVAGLVGPADAAGQSQKKRLQASPSGSSAPRMRSYRKPAAGGGESGYHEHLLDKVPFGSRRWWDIYEEQHGTPD